MNTILKMKSILENMNNKNDPRANLLYSLKPYLRDSKKNKVDQYVNMLNISKIADFLNKPIYLHIFLYLLFYVYKPY